MHHGHHRHLLQDLEALLARLRKDGYAVGPGDLAVLHALTLRLMEHGGVDETGLEGMFKAVLCRNQSEQQRFSRHFREWLQVSRKPSRSESKKVTEFTEAVSKTTLSEEKPKQPKSRPAWVLLVISVLLAGMLFSAGVLLCRSGFVECPWVERQEDIKPDETKPEDIKPEDPKSEETKPEDTKPDETKPEDTKPEDTKPDETKPEEIQSEAAKPEPPSLWQKLLAAIPPWLPWLLLLPLAWWGIQRLNRRYLRRHLGIAPKNFDHLLFYVSVPKLFQSAALSHTFQQLRRHQAVPTEHLDVQATLESSVRNLGLFTPVNFHAQQRPEYLILVDRSSPSDQQTALVEGLLQRLAHEGIVFSRWYFEHDPRWCYEKPDDFTPQSLADLGGRYAGRRLLIFSAGHRFIDPLTGRPADWLEQLAPWPRRVLLTLEPANQWRYLQKLLYAEGLLVAPADERGLQDFLAGLHREALPRRDYQDKFAYPALLVQNNRRWLQRLPPPPVEQRELLRQLRAFLDPDGFRWLAACAVYPELHWPLTLYLGEQLGVLQEKRLARLTSLPWLRRNYLPDWLRLALLRALPWMQRRRLRHSFFELLASAWKSHQDKTGRAEVDTRLAAPESAAEGGEQADQISVEFLAGKLGVPVPGVVRRSEWRQLAATLLLGAVALWFSFSPQRDTALERLVEILPPGGIEKQEIGRLDLTTAPDSIQLTLTHPAIAPRRETVTGNASLWLRAGAQTLEAVAPDYNKREYKVEIQAGQTVSLDIQLTPLSEPDQDRDGVPDTRDRCSDTPQQIAVDAQGCPPDRDGDKVPDYLDACPANSAEEINRGVDAKGCPEDSDGDGIPDYRDKCPNTRADVVARIDAEGCVQAPAVLKLEVYPADARLTLIPSNGGEAVEVARMERFVPSGSEANGMRRQTPPSAPDSAVASSGLQVLPLPTAAYRNELRAGKWTLRAQADGFEPLQRALFLQAGQELGETVKLERPGNQISLTVQTIPPEARVRIMNIRPVYRDGILLDPGPHDIEVTHDGYAEWRETRDLAQDSLLQVVLAQLHTLNLQLVPSDATVQIETLAPEQTPTPWAQLDAAMLQEYRPGMALAAGRYALHVRHFSYLGKQETLELQADSKLVVELEPAPTGTLRLHVTPEDARIEGVLSVQGITPLGLSSGTTPLAAGDWTIRAEADNHEPKEQTVTIRVDETTEMTLALTPRSTLEAGTPFRDKFKDGSPGPAMVPLPKGTFDMGSPNGEAGRDNDEGPVHRVTVSAFAIGRYEVTFAEYDKFAQATGRSKPDDEGWGRGQRPVINVSWEDATAYAAWLSDQTGVEYRLPTEAEWEYAARAGTVTPFYTGNCIDTEQANYDGNYTVGDCPKADVYRGKTVEAGSFSANPFGLHDTAGNVHEWVQDWWKDSYSAGVQTNPAGPEQGSYRVIRGGAWDSPPRNVRSAGRAGGVPGNRVSSLGFRLARTEPRQPSDTSQIKPPEMVAFKQRVRFKMGSERGDSDEKPVHDVTLSPFEIGKYEVTVREFKRFVDASGYETEAEKEDGCYGWTGKNWDKRKEFTWRNLGFEQQDDHPVACVSWNDAQVYIEWLNEKLNMDYRLPTEAEWEYAARGGTQTEYWWGDEASHEYANYGTDDCCNPLAEGKDKWEFTGPVGSFPANLFGLYDTAGNVWEWVEDWYGNYPEEAQTNPIGPGQGSNRVFRGGAWNSTPRFVRSANRDRRDPGYRVIILGFRLARTIP